MDLEAMVTKYTHPDGTIKIGDLGEVLWRAEVLHHYPKAMREFLDAAFNQIMNERAARK